MKKHITTDSKSNEIKMLMNKRSFKNKVFILLEGKTDIKLFRKLFDTNKVQLESLNGKGNVIQVVNSVLKVDVNRIVGISDADFDHILGKKVKQGLCLTDTHDVETLIINGVGLDAIIAEYSTSDYYDGLRRNLFKHSFNIAYEIGLLKLVNCSENYGLNFKELDFNKFISVDGLNVNFNQQHYINEVISNSKNQFNLTKKHLISKVDEVRKNTYCQYMMCSGHDISQLISMIMSQRKLSIIQTFDQSDIEATLRMSYGINDFRNTNLYKVLNDWSVASGKEIFVA